MRRHSRRVFLGLPQLLKRGRGGDLSCYLAAIKSKQTYFQADVNLLGNAIPLKLHFPEHFKHTNQAPVPLGPR